MSGSQKFGGWHCEQNIFSRSQTPLPPSDKNTVLFIFSFFFLNVIVNEILLAQGETLAAARNLFKAW